MGEPVTPSAKFYTWPGSNVVGRLLKQHRSIHCINPAILLVPRGDVVEFLCILGLHQGNGLLQLLQVLPENRVAKRVDELGEIANVSGQGTDPIRVDALHIR